MPATNLAAEFVVPAELVSRSNPETDLEPTVSAINLLHEPQNIPTGFLSLSNAIEQLAGGMWGGFGVSAPVLAIKLKLPKLQVGFGPRRTFAAKRFSAAVLNENLAVYVLGPQALSQGRGLQSLAPSAIGTIRLSTSMLARLIKCREAIPDHSIRPSMKTVEGNVSLLVRLTRDPLVVREDEFNAWYRSEYAKGKWPSQRSRLKKRPGRPTSQDGALMNAVLALVRDQVWSAKDGIAMLHRTLLANRHPKVPSCDTLERLIARLHTETGDPAFFRTVRVRQN